MLYVFNVYVPPPFEGNCLSSARTLNFKVYQNPSYYTPKYVFLYLLNLVQPLPKSKKFEIPLSSWSCFLI